MFDNHFQSHSEIGIILLEIVLFLNPRVSLILAEIFDIIRILSFLIYIEIISTRIWLGDMK